MKIKVLFISAINPHSLVENLYPPLWPGFLAAYAEKNLPPGQIHFFYGDGDVRRLLDQYLPDLVAISSVTKNYGRAIYIAREAKLRGIPVVVGGMHISSLPTSLSPEMDAACIGEGEETFLELLRLFLDTGRFTPADLSKIKGIAYYDHGALFQTELRKPLLDINDLPHPNRSLIGYGHRAYIYTSRGCAYRCVFCSCTRFWGNVRHASADYIIEELEELAAHGVRVVRFADENFISNVPRLNEIHEKIRQRGLDRRLKFSCWCRANGVTSEIARMLRSMNVTSVKLGLESGSQRMLDYLKGQVTVEQNRQAVRFLKNAGLQVNADFLFGAPDETLDEMKDTYEFIRTTPIDLFDVNIFSPLPGTPVWKLAVERGLVDDRHMDWGRLDYKFHRNPRKAIHLSNRLYHGQLKRVHGKFQRLRFIRMFKALPTSPWRAEFPGLALKQCRLWARKWADRTAG